MTEREVVRLALAHEPPPYVPWHFGFTEEARDRLAAHYGRGDLDAVLGNHLLELGNGIGFFEELGDHRVRDVFGVVWDRSVDHDIGIVEEPVLARPSLEGYDMPDPLDGRFFADIPDRLAARGDCFRVYQIGFSVYERAWTMRGMENLMMDMMDRPGFVRELLHRIVDYNIAQAERALEFDIDGVYFGDDWGQQRGLQMGPAAWRKFIAPELKRMYAVVREAGRHVFIHSCGDVDELFDELVDLGVTCFNPFQPEVMDVDALMGQYRGRLAFHGGLSTQRTLPYGTVDEVRAEADHLLALGRHGGYILAPAHAVEGDVPLENMLAFIERAQAQAGYGA